MNIKESLLRMLKLVTFRISREELSRLNRSDLYLGLFVTWVVGMGRYWDDPKANVFQHLGVGSVIYIFVLAGLIWLMLKPFKISDWRYQRLLTFVSLTSLPAIFYAIPVELYFDVNLSARINAYFLLAVATWRVALLIFFLRRSAQLSKGETIVGAFLPITLIVTLLTALNLERAVFDIMGGMREKTSHDSAYGILVLITMLSMILFVPLLIGYIVIWVKKRRANNLG
jgi:hypothetical protein